MYTLRGKYRVAVIMILIVITGYGLLYFNYFETPTADFIGQHRVLALEIMEGKYTLVNRHKFMPLYPALLALLTSINPLESHDRVYSTAIILNIVLYVPYLLLVFFIFRRFLSLWSSAAAMLFLGLNIFSVYTAVNSELEMTLSLLIVTTVFLSLKNSKWSYCASFFAATTKWDSVFAVPAAMFRDFFHNGKKTRAIVLGGLASTGAVAMFILSMVHGNVYVREISQRGPSTYEYLADTIVTVSGYMAWMATGAYFTGKLWVQVPAYTFVVLTGVFILACIVWGVVLLVKHHWKEAAPIMVFMAGYVLIHMIYQNTKERYVMPVLWAWFLFLFYGLSHGLFPWIRSRVMDRMLKRKQPWIVAGIACFGAYGVSLWVMAVNAGAGQWLFAVLFTAAAAVLVGLSRPDTKIAGKALLVVLCGTLINFSVSFGLKAMDHYSLRRVEFKKAGVWFREHARRGERMLVSEIPVTAYYAGVDRCLFTGTSGLKSSDLDDLVRELALLKIDYVFVDDFYIRRLRVKDQNAYAKKAPLLLRIREHGAETGHFILLDRFETRGGIESYMFRFLP